MGKPRCRVSGCWKDAAPGYDYCEKHGGVVKRARGRPREHTEIVSDLLEEGSKKTEINQPIRELAKLNPTLEELEEIAKTYEQQIKQKEKEFYDKKAQGYDDADMGYPLTTDIKNLQGILKKLYKWIKHKKLERNIEKYSSMGNIRTRNKPLTEEEERECAILKTHEDDEDLDDGEWHNIDSDEDNEELAEGEWDDWE